MTMYAKPSLEDDVSLAQIWQMMSRNRWLVGPIFVVFMIAGYILWYVLPPTYQAHAQINIGNIGNVSTGVNIGGVFRPDLFEQPGDLIARLVDEYGLAKTDGAPVLKVAKLRKGTTNAIELVAEGRERDAIQAFLESVTKGVVESHGQVYDRNVAELTAQLKAMDNHRQALEKVYAEISQFIHLTLNTPRADSTQFALLSIQRGQLRQALIDLDMKRPAIISSLNPPSTNPTVLVGKINTPDQPAAPKRGLILAAAAMLGMIFGGLAALGRDTIHAARTNQQTV
jgi:uncharacterized protein involved in exopolysaccharide biosynthesis